MLTIYTGNNYSKNRAAEGFFEQYRTSFKKVKIVETLDEELLNKFLSVLEMELDKFDAESINKKIIKNDELKDVKEMSLLKKKILENPLILRTPILVNWDEIQKGISFGFNAEKASVFWDKQTKKKVRMNYAEILEREVLDNLITI